ncbi:MAG: NAD(P)H-binding protein [Chloroflexota bacterium]|nr:NAD(P)H-binding protein [Chloroflexota bacterium]
MATHLVTGAFGFTGSRIAERLLAAGHRVRTLSRRTGTGHALAGRVEPVGYDFSAGALHDVLRGVDTLYVTYWMRFPGGGTEWVEVVSHVRALAQAAARARVRRIVYISVSNAGHDAPTAYFRAKAQAEDGVRQQATSYAIVRPTLLYGEADILINNMAWTLRRLPVFGVPGDGRYRVQPVYVEDVADLCLWVAEGKEPIEIDACGPETFAFDDLVRLVGQAVGRNPRLIHLPPAVVLATTRLIGLLVRDVVLTRDELRELMAGLLVSRARPTCPTRFSEWIERRGAQVGRRYASELARNFSFERG